MLLIVLTLESVFDLEASCHNIFRTSSRSLKDIAINSKDELLEHK